MLGQAARVTSGPAAATALRYATRWGAFAAVLFRDAVYQHPFPPWSRRQLPAWFGVRFGAA